MYSERSVPTLAEAARAADTLALFFNSGEGAAFQMVDSPQAALQLTGAATATSVNGCAAIATSSVNRGAAIATSSVNGNADFR